MTDTGRTVRCTPRLAFTCRATLLAAALLAAGCNGTDPQVAAEPAVTVMRPREAADPSAQTRSALYASMAEAKLFLAAHPGRSLSVEVGACCGFDSAEQAVQGIWGEQIAADLPRSVPVFVTGVDLRLAATAVDMLGASGFTRVYLVDRGR